MPNKKLGRPVDKEPKDIRLQFRFKKDDVNKLDECVKHIGTTRSDIVRKGIMEIYKQIQKK